jgi:primary-amine oxidase
MSREPRHSAVGRSLRGLTGAAVAVAMLVKAGSAIAAGPAPHPLDPLSAAEIETAVAVLRDAGYADDGTRFATIDLDEPVKAAVLGLESGHPVARRAFVIARRDRVVHEAVVELAARRVERWAAIPGVQSAVSSEEWAAARRITREDAGWREAMRGRGYTGLDRLVCTAFSAGNIGDPGENGRRLVRVACFDGAGTSNFWARPIEGVVAVVDLDEGAGDPADRHRCGQARGRQRRFRCAAPAGASKGPGGCIGAR